MNNQLLLSPAPASIELVDYLFEMSYIRLSLDNFLQILSPLWTCVGRCQNELLDCPQEAAAIIRGFDHLEYYLNNMPCLKDDAAWDRVFETLSDSEWVIYQKWRNRPKMKAERTEFVLKPFFEGLAMIVKTCRNFAEAVNTLADFGPLPKWFESSIAYAIAGYPLGKSHRGRKKWLKRQANGQNNT